MENPVELIAEAKQVWVAPELQKVDVEEITAGGTGLAATDADFITS
jgi:hypothetical protein